MARGVGSTGSYYVSMSDEPVDPPISELMEKLIAQSRVIAWRYWHSAPYVLDFEELVSLAYKGLVEAHSRWPAYCEKNGYNPDTTRYFTEYSLRRMRGSILDYMRAQDWVPRTVRDRSRALRDAGQDQGQTQQQMAEATGMTRQQVSDTLAAMARRPVGFDPAEHDVQDAADTESSAVVDDLLATAVGVMQELPLPVQFALALTFYSGLTVKQAAEALGMEAGEVQQLQQTGVLAVHSVLAHAAREKKDGID
jgi:RNA polymerase sigma factor for flagellar operon FliA